MCTEKYKNWYCFGMLGAALIAIGTTIVLCCASKCTGEDKDRLLGGYPLAIGLLLLLTGAIGLLFLMAWQGHQRGMNRDQHLKQAIVKAELELKTLHRKAETNGITSKELTDTYNKIMEDLKNV
jgi:hypothetical protein